MPDLTVTNGLTHRIPAWKKLGLKLKYVKDDNGDNNGNNVRDRTESVVITSELTKKRKRHSEEHTDRDDKGSQSESSKKLKKSSSTTRTQPDQSSQDKPHSTILTSSLDTQQSNPSSAKKRRSVAFTPDTKEKDGDSTKQLYNAWVEKQRAEDPQFRPEKIHQALRPQSSKPETGKKAKKNLQKDGNSSTHLNASDNSTSTNLPLHPAIAYLDLYHRHREQWKFNKAKQSYLLKHLLDLDRIPPEYDKALVIYVANLQSDAARARVKEAMERASRVWRFPINFHRMLDAARDADYWSHLTPEELAVHPQYLEDQKKDDLERHQRYEAALNKFVDALRDKGTDVFNEGYSTDLYGTGIEKAQKLDRAKRAEAIIWALSEQKDDSPQDEGKRARSPSEEVEDTVEKRVKLNDGSAQRHVRKRKLRTNATEEESTSSESSSSTSESSSATEGLKVPSATKGDGYDGKGSSGSSDTPSDSKESSGSQSAGEDESDETDSDEESDDEDESSSEESSSDEASGDNVDVQPQILKLLGPKSPVKRAKSLPVRPRTHTN